MAAVVRKPGFAVPGRSVRTGSVPVHQARKSMDEWSDREAGLAAVGVIAGLGLVILLIVGGVVLYATTWGYAISLG